MSPLQWAKHLALPVVGLGVFAAITYDAWRHSGDQSGERFGNLLGGRDGDASEVNEGVLELVRELLVEVRHLRRIVDVNDGHTRGHDQRDKPGLTFVLRGTADEMSRAIEERRRRNGLYGTKDAVVGVDGDSAGAPVDECSHDSSPSVGGCGDPQPTEGEARKGDAQ